MLDKLDLLKTNESTSYLSRIATLEVEMQKIIFLGFLYVILVKRDLPQ